VLLKWYIFSKREIFTACCNWNFFNCCCHSFHYWSCLGVKRTTLNPVISYYYASPILHGSHTNC